MVSYWIGKFFSSVPGASLIVLSGYGTNYIGGTGESQSNAAWLIPVCIQILPALILGVGILYMPERLVISHDYSPLLTYPL